MRQTSKRIAESAEKTVRDIRRNTRRHHSAEEKIRIVLKEPVVPFILAVIKLTEYYKNMILSWRTD